MANSYVNADALDDLDVYAQMYALLDPVLGDGTVTVVEVLGPLAPTWKHGQRRVRDGRGPRDTYG